MKRKFLEDLGLEKDVIDKIMTENGADIEAEKAKTTEATTKLEDINKQLETANDTIKDLKKSNSDNEELQNKVKTYEDDIKTQKADYEAKIRNLTLDAAIEKALTGAKAKHTDLISTKIDKEKLIIGEDGKVSGLDEQITGLKESYKDLFEEDNQQDPPPTFSKGTDGGKGEDIQINSLGSALSAYYNNNK